MDGKQIAGEKAVEYIEDGMLLGLGTGSTVYWTLKKLGKRVKEGLRVQGVPTSRKTGELAAAFGIPLLNISETRELDLTIDGADEVDRYFNLIKGGGGALLREKMVATISRKLIIVVDESKTVPVLGRFPLPVEVVPYGWEVTRRQISELGCTLQLRYQDEVPFLTDNGNYILDCRFTAIEEPQELSTRLNSIPGVVENGLFVNRSDLVIVGGAHGVSIRTNVKGSDS
ncbi:ribose-5-phosphate isomerase RpiA [Paenibacillus sp. J2TS4]|uniref:ribose-5-phosphate isomerase RpiA n=1 Tax=Paenibacillus sp. J2TS4 TaxID=2807194 RepID=UPI001B1D0675|nr:ribose-5-phosphate isomerase RpiA [Paenibacillus sp. J2TS4]GIP34675.1 ribose-5-phosphate isomerase A [Paenibacillus sp. J2TS4]